MQIQMDNAAIQVLTDKLLSIDDERTDLKRRRDALTLQMGKIEEDINHLDRVVFSKEEERNELHRNLNDAMDEPNDEVKFGPLTKKRQLGNEGTSTRKQPPSQEPFEWTSRRAPGPFEESG